MTRLTPSRVLDAAADLIEPEGAWTRKVYARRTPGSPTSEVARSALATCFCMVGAVAHVADMEIADVEAENFKPLTFLSAILHPHAITVWNDSHTQAEAVAALRQAAALARKEGM